MCVHSLFFVQYLQVYILNKLRLSAHRQVLQTYNPPGSTKPLVLVFNLGIPTKDGSDSYFSVITKGVHICPSCFIEVFFISLGHNCWKYSRTLLGAQLNSFCTEFHIPQLPVKPPAVESWMGIRYHDSVKVNMPIYMPSGNPLLLTLPLYISVKCPPEFLQLLLFFLHIFVFPLSHPFYLALDPSKSELISHACHHQHL